MLLVGESLNACSPRVSQAIADRDAPFIQALAERQLALGADTLDVNAATGTGDEAQDLTWVVQTVQAAVHLPLMLDSADPHALRAALAVHEGKAMVNSVNGTQSKLASVVPLLQEYGCGVVALSIGEDGIPCSANERQKVAERIIAYLIKADIPFPNIYLDPLIFAISTDTSAGNMALRTLSGFKAAFPKVKTIVGLSNISFGLPMRRLLNRTFLSLLLDRGLDACIADVLDPAIRATALATEVLVGRDQYCATFTRAYRSGMFKGA
ncbi:MAG: dihydropteroate synthase [Thermaerobacter sp.]|nr:dihydropteroate synthase [Thermaerobacter sp.]